MIDDMTNNGLRLLAELLTGGSIEFEKTRWKMRKIIRESLPGVFKSLKGNCEINIADQLLQILMNSDNFRSNYSTLFTTAPQSYRAAAIKVLDGLEDMPFQTLSAMHRKLRGVKEYVPRLQPTKSGWGRSILIDQVRKSCVLMLSELGEEDELQEPLAKAMAVGGLSSKLIQGCSFVTNFRQFSPEIEALQNEIATAIWLLKEKVRFEELKNLQLLLDPYAKLSNRSFRTALRNLLTEYLFECSDMDAIPDYLLDALAIINGTSRNAPPYRLLSKEEREEEVESVLNTSAQLKQILWDLLPENEFDEDFADAYMEDLEESDTGDDYDNNDCDDKKDDFFHPNDMYDQIESIGETNPANSNSPASTTKRNKASPVCTPILMLNSGTVDRVESEHVRRVALVDSNASASSSCSESDSLSKMEADQLCAGTTRNLETNNPHSLSLETEGRGSPSHFSADARSNSNCFVTQEPEPENPSDFINSASLREEEVTHDKISRSTNQYLAVQEACDKTSIVAYRLIGSVLDEFAQIEGIHMDWDNVSYLRGDSAIRKDSRVATEECVSNEEEMKGSIIVRVLEDIFPSFPESGKERVKELMGLK